MSYKLIRLSAGLEMRVDIPGRLILVDSVSTGQGVDISLVRSGTPSPYIPGRQAGFRLVEDFGGVLLRSALDCEVGIFLATNDVQLGGTAGGAVVIPSGVAVTNDLAHSIPVTLTSSSNTTPIPVSLASIRVNNTPAQAIPVNFAGTVAPVLGVVTVDNTNAEAIPVLQKPGEVFEVHVNNVDGQALPVVQKAGTKFAVTADNTDAQAVPVRAQALAVILDATVVVAGIARVSLISDATLRKMRVRNSHATAILAIGGVGVTMANAAIQLQPGEVWLEDDAAAAGWYAVSDTDGVNVQIQGLK
ncbi:MAG: hypothetical protein RR376_03420 [Janthinobacterium sp.]